MWLLSHDNTTLVLAYKERKAIEARFFERLWEHFDGARLPETLELSGVPESSAVQLFTFRRRRASGNGGTARVPHSVPYCATAI